MALARAGEAVAELSSLALAAKPSAGAEPDVRGRMAPVDVEPVTFIPMHL
jgi:hypothetical protein